MKREDPFPELAVIEERIRAGLSEVRSLAPRQIDEVFRPLPPGTDYLPSSLFLLACRSCGVSSEGTTIFACALRSFSLAFRMLFPVTVRIGRKMPPRTDHEHGEGMALLVSDGLFLMAHNFLADLYATDIRRLVPILVTRPREWIGKIESAQNDLEGIASVHRSMSETAVQAVRELIPDRDESTEWIEHVTVETDRLLSAYRKAAGEEDRRSVVEAFDGLLDSVRGIGEHARPLARYVSLVSGPLSATSAP